MQKTDGVSELLAGGIAAAISKTCTAPLARLTILFQEMMINRSLPHEKVTVIFVLGGPGSGKSTQCPKIAERYGFTHLSAGELLRAEASSGSENSTMIQNIMKEGNIVPSELTVKLLQQAMRKNGNDKFLIDGFPRDKENLDKWEKTMGIEPKIVLHFDCSQEVMVSRLLGRNQGREDDKLDTIRERFKVFVKDSLPLKDQFSSKGKLQNINAERSPDKVFEEIKGIFHDLL